MKRNAIVNSAFSLLAAFFPLLMGCTTTGGVAVREDTLAAPRSDEHRRYLGLSPDTSTFVLEDVEAHVVIVEIFDVYCRVCQKAAPGANALYERIQTSPHAEKIKMLAVGTGDTQLEIDLFTKKFETPFPSVPDPEKNFCMELGYSRTPEFIVLRRTPEGTFREIGRRVSYFKDAGEILAWILERAGLE